MSVEIGKMQANLHVSGIERKLGKRSFCGIDRNIGKCLFIWNQIKYQCSYLRYLKNQANSITGNKLGVFICIEIRQGY